MSVFRDDFQQRSQGFERAYRATEDDSSLLSNCPFIDYSFGSSLVRRVEWLMELFIRLKMNSKTYISRAKRRANFTMDFPVLQSDRVFKEVWPEFCQEIYENPEITLAGMSLAIHQVILNKIDSSNRTTSESSRLLMKNTATFPYLRARLVNYGKLMNFKDFRAGLYGRLIVIQGTVIRVGNIVAQCRRLAFSCRKCSGIFTKYQQDGKFSQPSRCILQTENGLECSGNAFRVLRHSKKNLMVECQIVKVQEESGLETSRIPKYIDCHLTEDLAGQCTAGATVSFTGILKADNENEEKITREKNMYTYYFEVVSICHRKKVSSLDESDDYRPGLFVESDLESDTESESQSPEHQTFPIDTNYAKDHIFTSQDYGTIREIYDKPHLFSFLVASLCPSIYGHHIVKAGLLLSLFGGNSQVAAQKDPKNPLTTRSDIHVLMIGDPGLGKSHLLRACAKISPRGVYACGNSTSSSGLTISLVKGKDSSNSNDYSLEAGALVLADRGTCCLDEFDQMKRDHQSLLETMEQQSVSLAKSGVVCSLPARTSVLAAANPVGGHYNQRKDLSENLNFSPALLSRFDLIFLLIDRPDLYTDKMLTDHVVEMHSNQKQNRTEEFVNRSMPVGNDFEARNSTPILLTVNNHRKCLKSRLEEYEINNDKLLSISLLQKYVAYAREYVHPELENEAKILLKNFYLRLRASRHSDYSTPVNPRQLESLLRLSQARAKAELRETVTGEDALDVIEIVQRSLKQVLERDKEQKHITNYFDQPTHQSFLNTRRSANPNPSFRTETKKYLEKLRTYVSETGKTTLNIEELRELASAINVGRNGNFIDIIDYINNQGFLIKKTGNVYQFSAL